MVFLLFVHEFLFHSYQWSFCLSSVASWCINLLLSTIICKLMVGVFMLAKVTNLSTLSKVEVTGKKSYSITSKCKFPKKLL